MQGGVLRRLSVVTKYTEAWLALLLFFILALIIVPMIPPIIDVFISINLMLSVVILLTSMYISRALDFSVFPAMLLVTTLLRISISIATARLILSNTSTLYFDAGGPTGGQAAIEAATGAAGQVIKAFGELVAGGSLVIGLIMFIIITVVQFVVVAQGAGRVSEVAARFTLDAMPGKQMAIDAELNARIITPEEAKAKRSDLESESNFFGSMDGAMKFVKGDAIAGMVIVVVNLIGGLVIGVAIEHMPFGAAVQTFSVLTIGQGLLEQIPALLISIAAGMVVTRSASPRNMGSELGNQLVQSPRALGISAGIIGMLGLVVPGLRFTLGGLALAVAFAAWWITRKANQSVAELEGEIGSAETAPAEEINQQMLRIDPIALEVGQSLADLADPANGGELLERLKHVRRRIAMEFGVIAPGVRVRPHPSLEPGAYQIRIKGDLVAEGHVMVTHLLGIGSDLDIPGIDAEHTTDPIYETPAIWLPKHQESLAMEAGLQVFDPQDVVSTHVAEIIKKNLDELLTREEVAELLNMARQDAPMVLQELVPNMLSLGQIRQVLQALVREQVPIKDMPTILNSLADQAMFNKDPFALTEHVRVSLNRKICQRYQSGDGQLYAFTLSPDAERVIQNSIQFVENAQQLMMDPNQKQVLLSNLAAALQQHHGEILDPVLVVNPRIRRHVRKLTESMFSNLAVLSYAEIAPGVQVVNLMPVDVNQHV